MATNRNVEINQPITPYFYHDVILNEMGLLYVDYKVLKTKFYDIVPDLNVIIDDLHTEGIIELEMTTKGERVYHSTTKGKSIVRDGGYSKYRTELDSELLLKREKAQLEVINLRQNVRKGSIEFYIMLLGSIGGFISFLILVIQFIAKIK